MSSHRLIFCAMLLGGILYAAVPSPAQNRSFAEAYKSFEESINQSEGLVDSLIEDLWSLFRGTKNPNDSLMARAIILHYNHVSKNLSIKKRIDLLRAKISRVHLLKGDINADRALLHDHCVSEFRKISRNDSMTHHLHLMENYVQNLADPNSLKLNLAYQKARTAHLENDFHASLNFLLNGLDYLEKHFPERVQTKLNMLNGIGIGYRRTNQQGKAIAHHYSTLAYLATHAPDPDWQGTVLNNLGLCYGDLNQHDSAVVYMLKAISFYRRLGEEWVDEIATGYNNIAQAYLKLEEKDNAIRYATKSLQIMREKFGMDFPDQVLPLSTLAEIHYKSGEYNKAASFSKEAIQLLQQLGWSEDDPHGNYFLGDAFAALATELQINTAIYKTEADTFYLQQAIRTGNAFMATVDYGYDNLKNRLSKELFQDKHGRVFSMAIDNLFAQFGIDGQDRDLTLALNYIEKYKSLELLSAAKKDRIEDNSTYIRLNSEQDVLQEHIYSLENKLLHDQDSTLSHQKSLRREITLAQEELHQWKAGTQTNHPNYYQLIYHPSEISVSEIREKYLEPDVSILSYHLSDDHLYIICVNKDRVLFEKVTIGFNLVDHIKNLRNSVFSYFASARSTEKNYALEAEAFVKGSQELYDKLIKPVGDHLHKRVIVIPDKALGYLPFDLLISETSESEMHQFKQHHFIVEDHAFSYCYSIPLWMEMQDRVRSGNGRVLAVAPTFRDLDKKEETSLYMVRSGLSPLKYSEREIHEVLRKIPGEKLIGPDASKDRFIGNASSYSFIHLATHGKANDNKGDLSYIAFTNIASENHKLYANEIYTLDLQAELITLSACESGLGELKSGEGIISLARAFSFAGAKSILSTLWSVNDKTTADLMSSFYGNLSIGMSKDLALQKAKLDYLQDADHAEAHPFFWSGFVAVGDMSPIIHKRNFFQWAGGLIFVFVLIWLIRYRIYSGFW